MRSVIGVFMLNLVCARVVLELCKLVRTRVRCVLTRCMGSVFCTNALLTTLIRFKYHKVTHHVVTWSKTGDHKIGSCVINRDAHLLFQQVTLHVVSWSRGLYKSISKLTTSFHFAVYACDCAQIFVRAISYCDAPKKRGVLVK